MRRESFGDDDDDDKLVREKWNDRDRDSSSTDGWFFRKFIPETTWGMAERTVVDRPI